MNIKNSKIPIYITFAMYLGISCKLLAVTVMIHGESFTVGPLLGVGNVASTYALNKGNQEDLRYIIKPLKSLEEANKEVEFHNALREAVIPTTTAVAGDLGDQRLDGRRYYLIKNRVNYVGKEPSLFNYLNNFINRPDKIGASCPKEIDKKLRNLSKDDNLKNLVKKIILSKLKLDDLHSKNIIWDDSLNQWVIIDGDLLKGKFNNLADAFKYYENLLIGNISDSESVEFSNFIIKNTLAEDQLPASCLNTMYKYFKESIFDPIKREFIF